MAIETAILYIFVWLYFIIFIEGVTEIITASDVLNNFRYRIGQRWDFWGKLVLCGYCTSVWIATICAFLVPPYNFPYINSIIDNLFMPDWLKSIFYMINFVIVALTKPLVLHRLSNVFHKIMFSKTRQHVH